MFQLERYSMTYLVLLAKFLVFFKFNASEFSSCQNGDTEINNSVVVVIVVVVVVVVVVFYTAQIHLTGVLET
jgi:hypothetical protein